MTTAQIIKDESLDILKRVSKELQNQLLSQASAQIKAKEECFQDEDEEGNEIPYEEQLESYKDELHQQIENLRISIRTNLGELYYLIHNLESLEV